MSADGHLLVILHEPPRPEETGRRGRLFWREPDGTWHSNSLGSGIRALEQHIDEYAEVLQTMEDSEDRAQTSDDYFPLLQAIAPVFRSARNMHDTLQQARETVREDRGLITARDHAYTVQRTAELLQSDIKNGLDCAIARRAEEEAASSREMAEAGHRLNVLAAVFFPVVTIASIFGMNLDHGLEHAFKPVLFWIVLLIGIVSGFVLKASIMRRPASLAAGRGKAVRDGADK
jgi:Mg2+ and Co2+ transporter CorA